MLTLRQTARWLACLALLAGTVLIVRAAWAQDAPQLPPGGATIQRLDENDFRPMPPGKEGTPVLPSRVDVDPAASDEKIAARLERILNATGWFENVRVKVQEGVVFLSGTTTSDERKTWAGDLARTTEAVVAVVNKLDVADTSMWDFRPAILGVRELRLNAMARLPWIIFGLVIFALAYIGARLTRKFLLWAFRQRFGSPLLRGIAAWLGGALVFLMGLYVVLYASGLTRLALTVLGGTGLIGLILGIGFRDISENFLASVFLSLQTPFRPGDLVQVDGVTGFVQRMTIRSTLLMTYNGNHVQIPNATIYKSTITNFTSNPNRREDFVVHLGLETDIAQAQDLALRILRDHPAVLVESEPMVLAESLNGPGVVLRVYFWINVEQHSPARVKSAVIRLVKQTFQEHHIRMLPEWRDWALPRELAARLLERGETAAPAVDGHARPAAQEPATVATRSEGDLASEAAQLEQQAKHARAPEAGEDLLKTAATK